MPKISKKIKFDLNTKIFIVIKDYKSSEPCGYNFIISPGTITGVEVKSVPRRNSYKDETLYETDNGNGNHNGWRTGKYLYKTKKECKTFITDETKLLIKKHQEIEKENARRDYLQALKTIEKYKLNYLTK
jgi:hypothetical protein